MDAAKCSKCFRFYWEIEKYLFQNKISTKDIFYQKIIILESVAGDLVCKIYDPKSFSNKMKAYILNILGWMLLPFMDGIAKLLSAEIHFMQVVWGRYFFMFFITLTISLVFFRKYLMAIKYKYKAFVRGFLLFITTILFFYSISIISLPEALTLALFHQL